MNRQGSEQRPRNSDSASPNPAVEAPGGRPFPGAALLAALALILAVLIGLGLSARQRQNREAGSADAPSGATPGAAPTAPTAGQTAPDGADRPGADQGPPPEPLTN
ncbi:MAG TPA: hypothetical protein VID50_08830 [Candidatus Eisenbacteria bacterium]|jgi:hypothetical protein